MLAAKDGGSPPDISTRAYNHVKNKWIQCRYWNERWGILPGLTWEYEDMGECLVEATSTAEEGDAVVPARSSSGKKKSGTKTTRFRSGGIQRQSRGEKRAAKNTRVEKPMDDHKQVLRRSPRLLAKTQVKDT